MSRAWNIDFFPPFLRAYCIDRLYSSLVLFLGIGYSRGSVILGDLVILGNGALSEGRIFLVIGYSFLQVTPEVRIQKKVIFFCLYSSVKLSRYSLVSCHIFVVRVIECLNGLCW